MIFTSRSRNSNIIEQTSSKIKLMLSARQNNLFTYFLPVNWLIILIFSSFWTRKCSEDERERKIRWCKTAILAFSENLKRLIEDEWQKVTWGIIRSLKHRFRKYLLLISNSSRWNSNGVIINTSYSNPPSEFLCLWGSIAPRLIITIPRNVKVN